MTGRKNGQGWKKLFHEAGPDNCWPWLGVKTKAGYGKKTFHKKTLLAHRWIYEQRVGEIPQGKVVDHLCGNPSCVNPAHLEIVVQSENCRRGKGTKLNAQKAKEIMKAKKDRSWGDATKLAKRFGVSSSLIHDIWNGRAWN